MTSILALSNSNPLLKMRCVSTTLPRIMKWEFSKFNQSFLKIDLEDLYQVSQTAVEVISKD